MDTRWADEQKDSAETDAACPTQPEGGIGGNSPRAVLEREARNRRDHAENCTRQAKRLLAEAEISADLARRYDEAAQRL